MGFSGIGFGGNDNLNLDYMFGNGNVDTQKTDQSQDVNDVGNQFTTEGNNLSIGEITKFVALVCEMPEIYPKANATALEFQERYESLMSKLTRSRGESYSGKSIMFDIYAMMDLIQQISQRMRNLMRELRRLENTAIYANIKAQAEVQREAAIAGLVAGAIMCAIQVGVVLIGMGMQLKAAGGGGFAGKDGMMKTATNSENIAAGLGKGNDAGMAKFNAIHKDSPLAQMHKAEVTKNSDALGKVTPEETGNRSLLQNKVSTAEAQYNRTNEGTPERTAAEGKLAEARSNLDKFDQEHGIRVTETNDLVKTVTPEQQQAAAAKDVAAAKDSYIAAQTKYQQASELEANGGKLPEGVSLDSLKANAELKGQQYEYAVAKQVDVANQTGMSPKGMSELKTQISKDAADINQLAMHGGSLNQQAGGANSIKGIMIQQVGMAVGQFLQGIATSIREMISARGTDLQALQKLLEEQFDQIKDLFSLQQSVIQKSIEIFASVIQKESSVLEQIFQHI